ncbi:hypothetical protein BDP27DRAFT_1406827 [Rhodocollybia butyracea]|uniref:Hydrophobin n=1 Tax=Rhodocollybia butyracea TaxID=206335 RepID=A0A9P5PFF1_9AGAR|nr:hypothetical protein BDP27DRAFT_1406827 [Rhodocollybia butyracea]
MHFTLALVVASLFTLAAAIPHPPGPSSPGFPSPPDSRRLLGGLLKSRGLRDLLDLPPFPLTHHSARSPSTGYSCPNSPSNSPPLCCSQSTETPNGEEGNGCFILEPNEPCSTNALCCEFAGDDGLGIDCDAASPA